MVGVRATAGKPAHSLRHQLAQRMIHLARLPLISKTGTQSGHQIIVPISGLQQPSSAVGTALALIKLGNDWLGGKYWEKQTLCCTIFTHQASLLCCATTV